MAIQQVMTVLYPNNEIDRTNLRIVSKPSPCLTDVAIYLTGGRFQFNSFYVDNDFSGLYIIQRIDTKKAVSIALNKGVKPKEIDSLGNLAIQQKLSDCELVNLKKLEYQFTEILFKSNPKNIFTITEIENFDWKPNIKNDYLKTDIINKNSTKCNNLK